MGIEQDVKQTKFRTVHNKLIVNLMFTSNWLYNSQAGVLKPHGLTVQQYNVLRILRGQTPQPVRINDIIERMMDKMSNASRLVDKLLQKGFVERTESSIDRRAVDVVITQAGLDVLTQLDEQQTDWESRLHTLNETEANELSILLDKLRG